MTTGVAKSTVIVVPVNVTPASSSTNPTADSRNIRPRIWRELGGGSFLLCVLLLPWWWAAPPPCERWWCDDTPAGAAAAFLRDSISRAHTHQPAHTHTHTQEKTKIPTHFAKQFGFQHTLQNNSNALCETKNSDTLCMQKQIATRFAKQLPRTLRINFNGLCQTRRSGNGEKWQGPNSIPRSNP